MTNLLPKLKKSVRRVRRDVSEGLFAPQNELDFNAYFFHTWLSLYPEDAKFLHLEARVKNYKESKGQYRGHADMAYGASSVNPETRREWIEKPELVVESKSFRGFTPNQKTIRRGKLKEDIEKLGSAELDGRAVRVVTALNDRNRPIRRGFFAEMRGVARRQKYKVHLYVV